MSTFGGKTKEYPLISLDRFDGKNLENLTFFLSHNHRGQGHQRLPKNLHQQNGDVELKIEPETCEPSVKKQPITDGSIKNVKTINHTVGLFTDSFLYKLQSSHDVRIYSSPVTRDLLLLEDPISLAIQRSPHISNCFVALDLEECHSIPMVDSESGKAKGNITVTLLPAKHCPGSVMFLIEGEAGTILYTGDFRLDKSEFEKMQQLKSGNSVKDIKSLYIDTTFCVPEAMYIPSREDSVESAINVIDEWISQSPHHVVHLKHVAGLGYEQMYREISNHFNMKVHVNRKKFADYKKVGDMHTFTTPNPAVTQIHACKSMEGGGKRSSHKLPCGYQPPHRGDELHVRTIKVSTMAFVQHVGTEKCVKMLNDHFYRVCYSFHASYSELRDVVMYLKPGRVFPNAVPTTCTEALIQERLNHFLKLAHKSRTPHSSQESRPLGMLKTKRKRTRKHSSQFSDDNTFDFMDDSPPKKSKHSSKREAKTSPKSESDSKPVEIDNSKNDKEKQAEAASSSNVECDAKAFPLLFGGCDSEDENETKTEIKTEKRTPASSVHDGSQDLFADDSSASEDELLPADKERMKSFAPVAGGSYGDQVGYVSECSDEDVESTDSEHKDDMLPNPTLPFRDTGQGDAASGRRISQTEKEKVGGKPLKTSDSSRRNIPPVSTSSRDMPSLEIVDISEPESESVDSTPGASCGRKRRLSESILDPVQLPLKHSAASKTRRKTYNGSAESSEEIPRPSVVRYPSSSFYSSTHCIDRTHAVRGYHNLMTNIEKILKSPTRNSLSDDADGNVPGISDQPLPGSSTSNNKSFPRHGNRKHEQLDYKHKKYRKYKTQPSASQSKPPTTEDSDSNMEATSSSSNGDSSVKHDIKSESDRSQWFDNAEECIDLTADDEDVQSGCSSSGSVNAVDVISGDDDNDGAKSCSSDVISNGSDVISGGRESDVKSCDVISDEISDDIDRDRSRDMFEDGDGYENGTSEYISDGEAQTETSSKSTRHRKHRRRRFELNSYSSDSDADSAATYDSDEWYLSVNRVRKAMKKGDLSSKNKMKTSTVSSSAEVIVLDDSSNCSAVTRPNSVSVSTQVTGSPNKVSPLAHQSSESLVELPSPVPKSWSLYNAALKEQKKESKAKRAAALFHEPKQPNRSHTKTNSNEKERGDNVSSKAKTKTSDGRQGDTDIVLEKREPENHTKDETKAMPALEISSEEPEGSKQNELTSSTQPNDNNNKSPSVLESESTELSKSKN